MSKKNSRGFTLIEIIIGIAILAVISVAFLTLFSFSITRIISAGRKNESQYVAQEEIENVIAKNNAYEGSAE